MKLISSSLVLLALFGAQEQVNAIKIRSQAAFTDDLVKSLAEDMAKDAEDDQTVEVDAPKKEVNKNAEPAKNATTTASLAQKKSEPAAP